jgi:ATP-dependent Lon protease
MATAIVSLVSGRTVRCEVGMTGEMTLRGQVMPVGGIKEKVLAAHRSGLKIVILPSRNEVDLEDLPDDVRAAIKFVFVDTIDDVLAESLSPASKRSVKRKNNQRKTQGDETIQEQEVVIEV